MFTNQIIKEEKLKTAFDNWIGKSNNANLDPLQHVQKIANSLKADLAISLSSHLKSIEMLEQGGLNWLIFKGVCKDIENINLDTPAVFQPVKDDSSWWPIAQFTIGLLEACKFKTVSFNSENKGALFQNLVAGKDPKSQGRLRGHTDAVAFPFQKEIVNGKEISASPDFVVLSGIRNPNNVPTWLAPAQKIYVKIDGDGNGMSKLLFEKNYDIEPQPSFDPAKLPANYQLANSCLRDFDLEGNEIMRFKNSGISVNDRLSKDERNLYNNALKEVTKSLENDLDRSNKEIYEEIVVEPGDVLIVNNKCALHGRGRVIDDAQDIGGRNRWLLRTYGYKSTTVGYPVKGSSFNMLP
jgi:L-asparagine oxygenase